MNIESKIFENALKAIEPTGFKNIPNDWIEKILKGWEIKPTSCVCGCNYAWLKPKPSGGALEMVGCVIHTKTE